MALTNPPSPTAPTIERISVSARNVSSMVSLAALNWSAVFYQVERSGKGLGRAEER